MVREREGIRRGEEKDTGGGHQWSDLLPGAGSQSHGGDKGMWSERGGREREGGGERKKQTDTGGGHQWSDLLPGAGTQPHGGDEGLCSEREKG